MSGEVVRFNPNDEDGRPIYIRGDDSVLRCDIIRAQLIHVQLGRAIAEAAGGPARRPSKAGDIGMLSIRQRNYILVLCSEQGLTARADRLRVVSRIVGRDVATLNDLTGDDAGMVIDALTTSDRRAAQAAGTRDDPF